MPNVIELKEKLKKVAEMEEKVYHSDEPRQFFIEWLPAKSVKGLLDEFTPDVHNSKAEAERQKLKQNKCDIDSMVKHRRSVAYMYSGKQCMSKHYNETELTLHVMGVPRMYWVMNELEQLHYTLKEGQSVWVAKNE